MPTDDFKSPLPPVEPPGPPKRPTLAPPWVALLCAWLGLITLVGFLLVPFLPGSEDPLGELHRRQYAWSDRWLPWPIYLSVVALFLGIVVLWQMRREPRPLPDGLVAQRIQAWAGIVLSCIGIVFIYTYVALFGPR